MAMTINTNIQSLNAQRNLGASQSSLSTSMQRLSSGLRINSAKDDAAGLAIAERMSAQVRGLNQAQRNANDGVSLAQTAEGALGTIGGNLQRIRELAVQSRNATNSTEDRAALQKEVNQLKEEIDRVATTTSFNGTKLLDGSFTEQSFQVGANVGERINISEITNARSTSLGTSYSVATAAITAAQTPAAAVAGPPASTTNAKFAEVAADTISVTVGEGNSAQTFKLGKIAAVDIAPASGAASDLTAADNAAIKQRLSDVATEISKASGGRVTAYVDNGKLQISSLEKFTFTGGTAATTAVATEAGAASVGFNTVDVSTVAGADKAILSMDAALKAVNSARADLGAMQNRFESVVANLSVNSENLSASKSRIMDADFASETANLSRSQILQQAGTAMVAQANQLPQGVLSLLR
ncbi:flagellin [Comamonas sp. F1-6]|uniref:flagellin n=1 Tax=Comamonas sp. F1-6 TaxID=673550 RepID=UPI0031DF7221